MADEHQFYQTGNEHISTEHDHSQKSQGLQADSGLKKPGDFNAVSSDCQHCCHCHALGQFLLAYSHAKLVNIQISNEISGYGFSYFSHLISPDNPPPIS